MKLALKHDCSVFAGKCGHTRGCLVSVCYAAMTSTPDAWWILQKEVAMRLLNEIFACVCGFFA